MEERKGRRNFAILLSLGYTSTFLGYSSKSNAYKSLRFIEYSDRQVDERKDFLFCDTQKYADEKIGKLKGGA